MNYIYCVVWCLLFSASGAKSNGLSRYRHLKFSDLTQTVQSSVKWLKLSANGLSKPQWFSSHQSGHRKVKQFSVTTNGLVQTELV